MMRVAIWAVALIPAVYSFHHVESRLLSHFGGIIVSSIECEGPDIIAAVRASNVNSSDIVSLSAAVGVGYGDAYGIPRPVEVLSGSDYQGDVMLTVLIRDACARSIKPYAEIKSPIGWWTIRPDLGTFNIGGVALSDGGPYGPNDSVQIRANGLWYSRQGLIDELSFQTLTTLDPFTRSVNAYGGVYLRDLVARLEPEWVSVTLEAANGYHVTLERGHPAVEHGLFAVEMNGERLSLRSEYGPAWLVYDWAEVGSVGWPRDFAIWGIVRVDTE